MNFFMLKVSCFPCVYSFLLSTFLFGARFDHHSVETSWWDKYQATWAELHEVSTRTFTPWRINLEPKVMEVWFRWFPFSIGWFLGSSRSFSGLLAIFGSPNQPTNYNQASPKTGIPKPLPLQHWKPPDVQSPPCRPKIPRHRIVHPLIRGWLHRTLKGVELWPVMKRHDVKQHWKIHIYIYPPGN